jgi:hypothetical protein
MPVKRMPVALTLIACWLAAWQSAWGVVVFERGKPQPTIGRLVRQDERSIVIELDRPGGTPTIREILRSDIEDLLIVVSEERLNALRPEDPDAYRDYAEELAVKRKDPDALLASLRLYLIAAHLSHQTPWAKAVCWGWSLWRAARRKSGGSGRWHSCWTRTTTAAS